MSRSYWNDKGSPYAFLNTASWPWAYIQYSACVPAETQHFEFIQIGQRVNWRSLIRAWAGDLSRVVLYISYKDSRPVCSVFLCKPSSSSSLHCAWRFDGVLGQSTRSLLLVLRKTANSSKTFINTFRLSVLLVILTRPTTGLEQIRSFVLGSHDSLGFLIMQHRSETRDQTRDQTRPKRLQPTLSLNHKALPVHVSLFMSVLNILNSFFT